MGFLGTFLRKAFGGDPRRLGAAEAHALLSKRPGVVILDVREVGEYRSGRLARSRLVPLATLPARATTMDREATYLVYCHSGGRSRRGAIALARAGCVDVYELRGGIAAWQRAGFEVVKK